MISHQRGYILAAVAAYVAAVAAADFLTPLVLDAWVLYLPVILVPVWFHAPRQVIMTASVCSLLMAVDTVLPHPNTPRIYIFGNLAMGLGALWLTALAGLTILKRTREITQTNLYVAESEERLRLAMEGAGMGTWDRNLRTQKTIWSDTHFRMLGYQPTVGGEVSVEMWQSLLHPDDVERVLEAQEQACHDRALFSTEYRILRADNGKVAWLAVFGRFLYDEAGKADRFLGVSFDITRRKGLQREVLEISDEQQRRISHELHDSVGQELTGMGLMANAMAQSLPRTATEQRVITRLIQGLDRIRLQVRNLSRGLAPVQIESKGLWAALDDLVASAKIQSGPQIQFDCTDREESIEHETATQLYHIAQESLSNALRHGHPQHVCISLLHAPAGLDLSIQDDGVGIKPNELENSSGMGFHVMRYRAEQIGASFVVGRAEGGGTVVTCTLLNKNSTNGHKTEPNVNGRTNLDRR